MGTTKTAIENQSNPILAFVVAIEGYSNLITTWPDTAAVLTAWAAKDFTGCLRGLRRPSEITQEIEPFAPTLNAPSINLVVMPDVDDTFGTAVFRSAPRDGKSSPLVADKSAGTGNVTVKDASGFAASGTIYAGPAAYTYSAITGSAPSMSFTVTGGAWAPWTTSGGSNFNPALFSDRWSSSVAIRPRVTNYPKNWVGSKIGCWVHRVVDGVLDTVAQAQRIFAGTIADIQDSESGATILSCVDLRDSIKNSMLLRDQYSAELPQGIEIVSADALVVSGTWYSDASPEVETYQRFETSAADATYFSPGVYTAEEMVVAINDFLTNGTSFTGGTSGVQTWSLTMGLDFKTRWTVTISGSNVARGSMSVIASARIATLLGFTPELIVGAGYQENTFIAYDFDVEAIGTRVKIEVTSPYAAAHSLKIPPLTGTSIVVTDEEGTFIDTADIFVQPWRNRFNMTASGDWGLFCMDELYFIAKKTATSTYTAYWDQGLLDYFGKSAKDFNLKKIGATLVAGVTAVNRYSDPPPRFKQVIFIQEDIDTYLLKTFASTGFATYNHATYDSYPRQMGLGIPWEILGDDFEASCRALSYETTDKGITVLIEEPTKFEDILLSEMVLRHAFLVFDNGVFRFTSPSNTSSVLALTTLTTAHKAASPDSANADFSQTVVSRDTIITGVKIQYDRDGLGKYHSVIEVTNSQAVTDYGADRAITISARNHAKTPDANNSEIRDLAANLSGDTLAFYNRPLPIVSRSLSPTRFFLAPGDSVSFSDNFVRDPDTGTRGVSAVPAWVLSVTQDWQTMRGSVDIVLLDVHVDKFPGLAPAGKINEGETDGGYTEPGGVGTLMLLGSYFSETSEPDDGSHFAVGDKISIVEWSPADPTAPAKWDRTVAAKNSDTEFELNTTLSSPAWDSTKQYVIQSQGYASTTATQQAASFIADDDTEKVDSTTEAFAWKMVPTHKTAITAPTTTTKAVFPATDGTYTADGAALSPILLRSAEATVTNIIHRRTTPQMPFYWIASTAYQTETVSTTLVCAGAPMLYYITDGDMQHAQRKLRVRPNFRIETAGATATVVVTSSAVPPGGTTEIYTSACAVTHVAPYNQVTFTSTDTDWTAAAAQDLLLIRATGLPCTWLTVEIKTSDGAKACQLLGMYELHLTAVDE